MERLHPRAKAYDLNLGLDQTCTVRSFGVSKRRRARSSEVGSESEVGGFKSRLLAVLLGVGQPIKKQGLVKF